MLKDFLKLTDKKVIVFILLIVLGVIDWFNLLDSCESPLFGFCPDYPFAHHPDVIPGLYPPLFFQEGCSGNEKISGFLAWECKPNSWKLGMREGDYCTANCNVNFFSWIYVLIYWYLLSCLAVFVYTKFKK
jgi:hypothetical protein